MSGDGKRTRGALVRLLGFERTGEVEEDEDSFRALFIIPRAIINSF